MDFYGIQQGTISELHDYFVVVLDFYPVTIQPIYLFLNKGLYLLPFLNKGLYLLCHLENPDIVSYLCDHMFTLP